MDRPAILTSTPLIVQHKSSLPAQGTYLVQIPNRDQYAILRPQLGFMVPDTSIHQGSKLLTMASIAISGEACEQLLRCDWSTSNSRVTPPLPPCLQTSASYVQIPPSVLLYHQVRYNGHHWRVRSAQAWNSALGVAEQRRLHNLLSMNSWAPLWI
ncbi:hypothetical protein CONLIGDRAFT_285914 [Coniochaeta ligniaria NRRL 30616]|uniref:Uncharacterized protein n=1 Tax=Coniochaeta ligniaria NRRL 30616 TaxID=1408157 RepID=A0A1J7ITJ8_9PEZI|nr:hypothetical protein CONLIGDRAFT_285914 [Coniochaeta ligniaria NRRL 30616]